MINLHVLYLSILMDRLFVYNQCFIRNLCHTITTLYNGIQIQIQGVANQKCSIKQYHQYPTYGTAWVTSVGERDAGRGKE